MSLFPSMPLFIDAYLADTTHLTAEEHGAYLLLLMAMWRRGGWVPNDNKDLARMCCVHPSRWSRVKKRLMPMLIEKDGELTQKKLAIVLARLKRPDSSNRSSGSGVKSNEINAKPSRANPKPERKKKEPFSADLAPSFRASGNGSAASGATPGFEGRYAPPHFDDAPVAKVRGPPSALTQQLIAKGLHKP